MHLQICQTLMTSQNHAMRAPACPEVFGLCNVCCHTDLQLCTEACVAVSVTLPVCSGIASVAAHLHLNLEEGRNVDLLLVAWNPVNFAPIQKGSGNMKRPTCRVEMDM